MTTKRVSLFVGTILGGALLLGAAGLVFAEDPMTSPSSSAMSGMSGGMIGGQGMMGGQGQSMMYGACVAHHATTDGGFTGDHNPGMHRGFAGWTGNCTHA